ncbi:MAG TPA: SRPBCC domain-containing protein [Spirochaetota bacterium]|nr:SRPBCC domain-containing protein [Spirochaetota bacterium]HRZ26776.1 SRPBCC domain-containing protein [Spirochaetota bacterium]
MVSEKSMFSITARTEIEINAAPERVWEVLTDLDSYREWNPMIRSARGRVEPGGPLKLHFNPPGTRGAVFFPIVLAADKNRRFSWRGRLRLPFIFCNEHYFILEEPGPGRTLLKHGMEFRGVVVPLLRKAIMKNTEAPFMLMNRALKERAEGLH